MRAGTLDERITWEAFIATQDEYGEPHEVWADVPSNATVWASVQSRAQGERYISGAAQEQALVSHTVRIRYRTDLAVQMRGKWRNNRYLYIENVVDPDGRKSELVLMCIEVQP